MSTVGVAAPTSSLNDLSWYARNPMLLAAAGSLPFPYRPGMTLPLTQPGYSPTAQNPVIPGIITLEWYPTFGTSYTSTDPASITAREIYGNVRDAYSGSLDADAPDFMVYLGALDSIFAYIGWLKRIYRTVSTYSPQNYYLPEGLMAAYNLSGNTATYLRQHKTELWQVINELILMTRKFTCPAVMDLFNRHYWMSDNVYADAPTAMAQLYVFNLIGVYKTQLVAEQDTGAQVQGLVCTRIPTAASSSTSVIGMWYNFGTGLIQALSSWDDSYTISGYLQRAYANVPSFAVAELLQDEKIEAQYVPEVLSQIENSRAAMPMFSKNMLLRDMYNIVLPQNIVSQRVADNAVVCSPAFLYTTDSGLAIEVYNQYQQYALAMNAAGIMPMLNIHNDAPTIADVTIATRLMSVGSYTAVSEKQGETQVYGFKLNSLLCGTEVLLHYGFVQRAPKDGAFAKEFMSQVCFEQFNFNDTGAAPLNTFNAASAADEQFAYHPMVYVLSQEGNASSDLLSFKIQVAADLYNPTIVQRADLENLHKVCLYSEFNSFNS